METARTHYRLLYRLDSKDSFLLWHSNEGAGQDGFVTTSERRIASFSTEESLAAFARDIGVAVASEEPILHDLDTVQAWILQPDPDGIDCDAALSAWNLFADVARSVPSEAQAFLSADSRLDKQYDKVFFGNNLPAITPEGEHYDPEWSNEEVRALAELMTHGLAMFRISRTEAV